MINGTCLKITVKTDPVMAESIADFLIGVFEAGVETGAAGESLYGIITAYIQRENFNQVQVRETIAQVADYLTELAIIFSVPGPEFSWEIVKDEDWGKVWKKHFKPFVIVPGLVIAPTWEKYQPTEGEQVITMDPGMAFGTGHHATTNLMLEYIQETLAGTTGLRLLDVGTGTGILGMAALLFGARSVYGIDNDPEAVAVAIENVIQNGMQDAMRVDSGSLDLIKGCYAITVANIVHNVLISMAADLARVTKENGILILSGLLVGEQVENVVTIFKTRGFVMFAQKEMDGWAALKFVKRVI